MLAHAIDHTPSTIVLISADRDFVYALSILRLRRFHVVVVSPLSVHRSLKAQAARFVDWRSEVLGITDPESEQSQSPPPSSHSATSPSLHSQLYRYAPFQSSSTSSPAPVMSRRAYGKYIDEVVSNASSMDRCPTGDMLPKPSKVSDGSRETLIGATGTSSSPQAASGASSVSSPVTRDGNPHFVNEAQQIPSAQPPHVISAMEESGPYEEASRNSSLSSRSGRKMVGHFPQNKRVTAWRNTLRKTSRSSSDLEDQPGSLQGQPHKVWKTCRNTLGSLLTFKRRDKTANHGERDVIDVGGASSSSSTNPSFITASKKSTSDLVSTQPSVEYSLSVEGVRAVPESEHSTAMITHLLPSPSPSPCPENTQHETHTTASATSTSLASSRPSYPLKPELESATVVELPTPQTASPKSSVSHSDSPAASGNIIEKLVPSQGTTSVTLPASPQHTIVSSPTPTTRPIIIPQHFQVLVDELQFRCQNGDTHPDRSSVAVSIYKRDPQVLERAGFTGKKAFGRYTGAAVEAGVVELIIPNKITIGQKVRALPEATPTPRVAHSVHPLPTPAHKAPVTGSTHSTVQASHLDMTLASTSSRSAPPPQFRPLIERLTRLQSKDVRRPFRSLVAIDVVREYPSAFTDAGVKDFNEYVSLAVKTGIVELGGEGSRCWVSLREA